MANKVKELIGKEKVFDHLILNEGRIQNEYNKGATRDEWSEVSSLLDSIYVPNGNSNLHIQNIYNYNQNLNRFVRRRTRR